MRVTDGDRRTAATGVARGFVDRGLPANPSGSVKGPAPLPIASRWDPDPARVRLGRVWADSRAALTLLARTAGTSRNGARR